MNGPFFPEWEFHTLMGLWREEMASILACWPECEDSEKVAVGVTNALNNLLGYPHEKWSLWPQYSDADPTELEAVLDRWLGRSR